MARRVADVVEGRVKAAIEGLDIPQAVKESIEWEITPALFQKGREMTLAYMVAVCLPVPGSVEDDYVLRMKPLEDAHSPQSAVTALVAELYGLCQEAADEIRAKLNALSNGHRKSPGGLYLPGA
jgi:hypothetical protein